MHNIPNFVSIIGMSFIKIQSSMTILVNLFIRSVAKVLPQCHKIPYDINMHNIYCNSCMFSISWVILLLLASPLEVFVFPLKHVILAWGKRTIDALVKVFSKHRILEEFAQCSALLSPPTLCPWHASGMD